MQKHLTQILKETYDVSEEDLKEAQNIKTEKKGYFGEILVTKRLLQKNSSSKP